MPFSPCRVMRLPSGEWYKAKDFAVCGKFLDLFQKVKGMCHIGQDPT
jgi:hypothetical protein